VPDDRRLAEHVAHFWWVAWDAPRRETVETLPHPTVHVTVTSTTAEILGVPTKLFRRRLPVKGWVFGVKFRPAAFHPWLGRSLAKITDAALPIADVLDGGKDYASAIRAAPDLAARCAIANTFFAARAPVLDRDTRELRDLVERMATDAAIVRVSQAAAIINLDARTLQRRFASRVGVSPKWVVQRYRLHEAAALLARGEQTIGAIAAQLGYFDQAHFAREFKAVVGAPPSAYLRSG
jgi:AraC-like DNA-binding protein